MKCLKAMAGTLRSYDCVKEVRENFMVARTGLRAAKATPVARTDLEVYIAREAVLRALDCFRNTLDGYPKVTRHSL